jgi:PKD repeat protein
VAAWYGVGVRELRSLLVSDRTLWLDPRGRLHHICEFLEVASGTEDPGDLQESASADAAPFPLDQTFQLHSNPGASRVIYLDFDGHVTSGTPWNSSYAAGQDIVSEPFSLDSDPWSFNDQERERIQYILFRVAEDFLPYDVDVTTEDPGTEALRRSGAADQYYGTRVVISPTRDWLGMNAGGIAYIGSFSWSSDTPCFAFSTALANSEKYIAEAVSHEVGHTLGLYHDGKTDGTEYYQGHGDWAPIMGVGYYRPVTQWSQGEYEGANNTEDDLARMQNYGISYRADDHGDSSATASTLSVEAGVNASGSGIIERNTDRDVHTFLTGTGTVSFQIDPAPVGPNLDVLAEIYDATGLLIASSDPYGLPAGLAATVAAGEYYLHVSGVGTGDPTTGYSDYASLGEYVISGTLVDPGAFQVPVAVASASPESGTAPLTVSFTGDSSYDPDGTVVGYEWDFGDGTGSSEANPAHTYSQAGAYTATLTVTDNDGLTDGDTVTVTADPPPNVPPVALASANPTTGNAPLLVQFSGDGSYDPDGTVVGYSWDFGDGDGSSAANPDHTYEWPGSYTASLTVTDDRGETDTATLQIEALQDPERVVYVGAIDMSVVPVPGGKAVVALVTMLDGAGAPLQDVTVYGEWSGLISGGVSGMTNGEGTVEFVSRKTKKSGTVTFTVTGASASGYAYDPGLNEETSDSVSTDEPANQKPVAVMSASPASGQVPLTVQFDGSQSYDPDGSLAEFSWDFGDGFTATGPQASHTYEQEGSYQAVLTVTDDEGATDSDSETITVVSGEQVTVHVAEIAMSVASVPGGMVAEATVTIVDESGQGRPGVTVLGEWAGPKSSSESATTGSDGTATFRSPKTRRSFTYTFTVTDVSGAGVVYDPAANVETSDSISYP